MGLIKVTLDHFLNKISKYLKHKFKKRVWNKENHGRLGNIGSHTLEFFNFFFMVHLTFEPCFTYYKSAESSI
jgi:hypothetical protein